MDELSRLGFLGAEMTLMRSEIDTYQDDEVAVIFFKSFFKSSN
jgi:hypothetical protein